MSETVKCDGCGKDSGQTEKPRLWYSRKDSHGKQFACSRPCIEVVAKATGKPNTIMPW